MQVLVEEALDLVLVNISHLLRGHGNHIPVLVASLRRQLVDILLVGEVVVEDAKLREVFRGDCLARIVSFALVALQFVSFEACFRETLCSSSGRAQPFRGIWRGIPPRCRTSMLSSCLAVAAD